MRARLTGLLLLLPLALIAGAALPIQFAVNSQLRGFVGGAVAAAAVSFVVGALALSLAALAVGRGLPQLAQSPLGAPWWVWTGGLLGAFFVLMSIVLTPRLGSAPTVGFFLSGQMIASVAIDHFGLFGLAANAVSLPRVLGVALVLGGVFLILRY